MKTTGLQWVWWPSLAVHWHRYEAPLSRVYRWSLRVGPLEIRRWV